MSYIAIIWLFLAMIYLCSYSYWEIRAIYIAIAIESTAVCMQFYMLK